MTLNGLHTTFSKRYKHILIKLLFSFTMIFAENVSNDNVVNSQTVSGTLTAGYSLDSSSIWRKTVPLTPFYNSCALFSNFEGKVPNLSALKKYWYAFDDWYFGGNSQIGSGTLDTITGLYYLHWYDETGSTGNDTCLQLKYLIGDSITLGENKVPGLAGFGTNTYDSVFAKYFDAKSAGVRNIYFHYITSDNTSVLTLEVRDINDVADRNNPGRSDGRGPGVVWHKNFPNTANKWVAVELPFDSLYINGDTNMLKKLPLDLTKLAKFTWKVYGTKGDSGTVAIDNVYLPGCWVTDKTTVITNDNRAAIVASYTNRTLNVSLDKELSKGNMSIYKNNGVCIVSKPISSKIVFSLNQYPSGIYIIKINAFDNNGKNQCMHMPVTIVN